MDVLTLTATEFIKPLSAGRTQPLLLAGEDEDGNRVEVVVKLRGREMGSMAQIAELVAAQLADDLGIDVPRAAVVEVPEGFERIVATPAIGAALQASPGPNFGSVLLASFTTWPVDRAPHGVQRDQAATIFAFDTLIQNPDRRKVNPNVWARSDRLGVFDHEQAFSSLTGMVIGGAPRPWHPADQASQFRFLEGHIFYSPLRGNHSDFDDFAERLGALSDAALTNYLAPIPASWREGHDLCEKIAEYLSEARQERQKLVGFIKHFLR